MKSSQSVKSFVDETRVDEIIAELRKTLEKDGQMPVYSDIYKEENGKTYQYVNYVQEGGGVLGVALVGYTYVLEKLGFRFLKLAGTSAGAINTIMLSSVDRKNQEDYAAYDTKSEIILHEMLHYDLWNLVDGSRFGKFFINLFINNKWGITFLKYFYMVLFAILIVFSIARPFITESTITTVLDTLAVSTFFTLLVSTLLVLYYLYRFDRAGFGINPGDKFRAWIMDILQRNNTVTTAELEKAMQKNYEDLKLRNDPNRDPAESNTTITPPYITLITSDVTNQTKVEFPLMAGNYWNDPASVSPADYVRASMSIPVFFEPFTVDVPEAVIRSSSIQQCQLVAEQYEQVRRLKKDTTSYMVRFVDGGILSNFPINIFHNPSIKVARMPTFGVKLEDEDHTDSETIEKNRLKFLPFLGHIFSTVRFYYDRDFLKKNAVYEKCIGHIDVAGFNWLDFGLNDTVKKQLFIKGAEAARTFLLGGTVWIDGRESKFDAFDWEKFKKERQAML